ncbi:hypothetical protein DVR12_12610 [Chitinophaga silvatica]|uniref:Uncharacterized protein n=1 Tax=Chitinophaga silvatica TaxID=2282649 RepID=A0A3E1YA84_9BACT|nr:hypothetical protein [Chitinophaga silvatica]RFS22633.1 hypothetical protein DVR12_12610 [Chitinophaga silvatica]
MKKRITIAEELKQIAPDCHWPSNVPFVVPEGYFDSLPNTILLHIKLQEINIQPFTVPDGYFDSLPSAILGKVKDDATIEINEISPVLAAIPKSMPYTVPSDYFSTLSYKPVTTIVRPLYKRSWLKWTAAASLALIVGSTILIRTQTIPDHIKSIENQISKFDEDDIISYLQNHIDPLENDALLAAATAPGEDASIIQDQLQDSIPPAAIENYLQQTDFSKEVLPDYK